MVQAEKRHIWLKPLLALSGCAYAVLLMQTESKVSFLLTAVLALVLSAALLWKTPLLEKLFAARNGGAWAVAGVLCLSSLYTAKSSFFSNCWSWMHKAISWLHLPYEDWSSGCSPGRCRCWRCLWPLAISCGLRFYKNAGAAVVAESDFTERLFLLGAGCLLSMMIVLTYMCTQGILWGRT